MQINTVEKSFVKKLYSDRIEITSAGGLPQELSQEEFLEGVTAPRSKELIRVFKDVDLIENIGSGVLIIQMLQYQRLVQLQKYLLQLFLDI